MSSLFLPPLHENSSVTPGTAGEWKYQNDIAFGDLAESLKLGGVANDIETVSSIPDMWARPLLVNKVLRDSIHPLHEKIKAQWQGMLSAIALAEVNGFKLSASLVDLSSPNDDAFLRSLLKLIPDKQKTLYTLDNGQKHPWEKIYVFVWEKRLDNGQTEKIAVGMTSPATLVCPAENGDWTGLPWYKDGRLQSPLNLTDALTDDEKIQLWLWLDNLCNELMTVKTKQAVTIKSLIENFKAELAKNLTGNWTNQQLRPSRKQQYFGTRLALGNVQALNNLIGAKVGIVEDSSVKLITKGVEGKTGVIFLPNFEKLLKQWHDKKRKDIWIYETSLASFDEQEFRSKYKDEYLTEADLFLDQFFFLKGSNKLLPGALLPKGSEEINYNLDNKEYQLTPLLPIQSKLLNYFSAEELGKLIELQPVNLETGSGVRVSIKIPLSGGDYTTFKDYPIRESNALSPTTSILEVFPNFKAEGWQEYYVFYYDDRTNRNQPTFQVYFPNAQEIHPPELENFQITRLNQFPSFIICRNNDNDPSLDQGIILLKKPPKVGNQDPNETWEVGVDFGTSFTNIYYQTNRNPKQLTLSPLHLQVTAPSASLRQGFLYSHFMSAEREEFPLSTVLTTQGAKGQERPIFDGRVYIPSKNIETFDPELVHIKTALKWSKENFRYHELFLKHLALLISVEAAQNHARKIEWAVSYPSSFSPEDKSKYFTTWKNIIDELNQKTAMSHEWLPKAKGKHFRTEALAMAQYLADYERKEDLQYTTCIDMGGGTSDISIWQENQLIHQCSLQLAGQGLFSQFLKKKVNFIKEQFRVDFSGFVSNAKPEPFYAKLDALLIDRGEAWVKSERGNIVGNPDLDYIVQLSTLGIAGLYYYVGKILEGLELEGSYKQKLNTPVFVGGNGSRIFHWLSTSGEFNPFCDAHRLFSRMLSQGSGFSDTKEETILSSTPKAEVACGLVLGRDTRLKGLDEDEDDNLFAGEECYINGQPLSETSRLHLEGTIKSFEIRELSNLKEFVEKYHAALRDLKIKSIKPLSCYRDDSQENQLEREELWRKVKRKVDNYCKNNMQGIANEIRPDAPFIIGLKMLLEFLNTRQDRRKEDDE